MFRVRSTVCLAACAHARAGNYGFPVLDTNEERVRFYHFEVVSRNGSDRYEEILECVSAKGWRGCTQLAELWLDQPLPARD